MNNLNFKKSGGLIPAIIQDDKTLKVLMLGYMNEKALRLTKEKGNVYFWSRSKERIWMKGETSGNILKVVSINEDCDSDALLIRVEPKGPTCHTGNISCFSNSFLEELEEIIEDRKKNLPKESYTASLFKMGDKKICEKITEESMEVVKAAFFETDERLKDECADLIFHLLVLLSNRNLSFVNIIEQLKKRRKG